MDRATHHLERSGRPLRVGAVALLAALAACKSAPATAPHGGIDAAPPASTDGAAGASAVDTAVGGHGASAGASAGTGGSTPVPDAAAPADGGAPPASISYEAELAFHSGGTSATTTTAGYTGTGFLNGFSAVGAQVVFATRVAAAGNYPVALRYAASTAGALTIEVNGYKVRQVALPASGGAAPWTAASSTLALRAGLNTIAYRHAAGDSGDVWVDALAVTGAIPLEARGATVPYAEQEAEAATQTGTIIGPSREYGSVAAECSGREAVRLDATGQSVSFTLSRPANALVVRYSIPDSADGAGQAATLGLYVGGAHVQDLELSSRFAWVYGAYPYGNNPAQGAPHRYFDERRVRLAAQPAGAVVELRKDAQSTAASVVIDLIDFEQVDAPAAIPEDFLSIAGQGAIADDGLDDTAAIVQTIAAARAQSKGVFVPAGTFEIASRMDLDGVTIAGAGAWDSVLHGKNGKGGLFGLGGRIEILDLAIFGDVTYRDDAAFDTGIEGAFGDGSLIENVWIEHTKVGLWFDAPTTGLYVFGTRLRDTFADGVNLHKGTGNTRVDQSSIRNTGDDGLAMFSEAQAVHDCAFTFDTVQLPMLANGVAIYGGTANRADDNLVADTVNASAGIAISTRFAPVPFAGPTSVERDTLTRTGGYEANWKAELGALWLYADTADLTSSLLVKDVELVDSSYQGILISAGRQVSGVVFEQVSVNGAGSYGIDINATGSATFSNVTVSHTGKSPLNNPTGYTLVRAAGDSGF